MFCLSNSVLEDKEKRWSTRAYASTTANCQPKIEEVEENEKSIWKKKIIILQFSLMASP